MTRMKTEMNKHKEPETLKLLKTNPDPFNKGF